MQSTHLMENKASGRLDHALWWLQRWVSGSMNDPDWEWPEAETMNLRQAFQIISAVVGNKRSAKKPVLWRFLTMPKRMAKQVIRSKQLPPNPKHPFQSFSGKKSEALAMMDYIPEGHVPVLVSAQPDPSLIPLGMADLRASRHPEVRSWLAALDHWHQQDEVMVLVTKPLPLLSAEIVDAQMEEVREANLWETRLSEGRDAPLYHFTTFRSLTSMAYHDALGLGRHDGKPPQVSLTRDPRLPLAGGLDTVLVLDQRALGTRYRMAPTYGDSRSRWAHDPQDESEERVTGRIEPLHRYLKAVHVTASAARLMQEGYDQALHKRYKGDGVIPGEPLPRAADLTAYLVLHGIPVYPRDPDDPMWHRRKVSPVKFPTDGLHEARKPKAAPFFFVLVRGHEARVEQEGDTIPDETDGWKIVWDSARSIEDGYAYAAKFYGAFPRDERFKPQPIQEPKTLYRSVSLPELVDIFRTGKIIGKSNSWNPFDSRRNIVFFGDELNAKLIGQGEEVERQAQVSMGDTIHREWDKLEASKSKIEATIIQAVRDEIDDINNDREADEMIVLKAHDEEALDNGSVGTAREIIWRYLSSRGKAAKAVAKLDGMRDAENALRARYRAELDAKMRAIKSARKAFPFTSAVIVTKPMGKGLHYSKAHGVSGMGDMDEYGFAPGQVTLDDVVKVIFIKDGKAVRSTDVEQARGLVDEIAPKLG